MTQSRSLTIVAIDGEEIDVVLRARRSANGYWTARYQDFGTAAFDTPDAALDALEVRLREREASWERRGKGPALVAARRAEVAAAGGEAAFAAELVRQAVERVHLHDGPEDQHLVPGVSPVPLLARQIAERERVRAARRGDAPLPAGGLFDETARAQLDLFS